MSKAWDSALISSHCPHHSLDPWAFPWMLPSESLFYLTIPLVPAGAFPESKPLGLSWECCNSTHISVLASPSVATSLSFLSSLCSQDWVKKTTDPLIHYPTMLNVQSYNLSMRASGPMWSSIAHPQPHANSLSSCSQAQPHRPGCFFTSWVCSHWGQSCYFLPVPFPCFYVWLLLLTQVSVLMLPHWRVLP